MKKILNLRGFSSQVVRAAAWGAFAVASLVPGQELRAQGAQSAAEKFVLQRLSASGEADLTQSGLKDVTLRHEFLEDLITSAKPPGAAATHGIRIVGAKIDGQLSVSNATIPFALTFDNCQFAQGFDLSSSSFARDFLLNDSTVGAITDPSRAEPLASFIGDRFAGRVSLDGTHFFNGVDFTDAKIDGALEADGAHFESSNDEADFNDIQVKDHSSFRGAEFKGQLDLTGAELAELMIDGIPPSGTAAAGSAGTGILIDHAQISKGLAIGNVAISGLGARSATVQGDASLPNLLPNGLMLFSGSHFQTLKITGFQQWLEHAKNFRFDGLSFDSISTDSKVEPDTMGMLKLLNQSPYDPQPYLALERYLHTTGHTDSADEAYFDMRARGRAQLDPFHEFLDWVQYALVGYGREIWKAALYAFVIILMGAMLFRGGQMVADGKSTDDWYNPFWYSLDLLSPIDLGVAKKWRAKNHLLRNYAQVHRVVGWILIPLIAAAITGIIR